MESKKFRYKSIDGFNAYRPLTPREEKTASKPIQYHPKQTIQSKPVRPITKNPSAPSLLNTTLPNQQFQTQFNPNRYKKEQKTHQKWSIKRKILTPIIIIFLIFIGVGGWLGSSIVGNLDKVFHGNFFSDATSIFSNTTLKGENQGRINILLAGDSVDQIGHGGASLADTIIVLSINTKKHSAFMLSIPRDLWVNIPGFGWQKINAANDGLGKNFPGYPQNGMGQLEHIVVTDLGIPIDYYSVSDYGAFRDVVNAVGGISVNIQSPDPRGLYDPNAHLKLANGWVNLDGQQALNLARARGDGPGSYGFPNSDFDRTAHQRQILTAIGQKAKSLGFLDNPIKISNLFTALGNNVQTNLSLSDVLKLLSLTKGISPSSMKSFAYCSTLTSGSCSQPVLTDYTDPSSGEEALIPTQGIGDYSQMQQYYNQLIQKN